MQLALKKLSKRTIKACLGQKTTAWARNIYENIYDRWMINRFHDVIKNPFDVIFFCWGRGSWPNIQPVVRELIGRRDDLSVGLVFYCRKDELPDSVYSTNIPIIRNIPLNLLNARLLYTPHPCLTTLPPKAVVVHALMSMCSIDGAFPDDAFDMYDYILCAGPHHLDSFRECALRRPILLGKRLLPAGYPKLDFVLASRSTRLRQMNPSKGATVIYAPTHKFYVNERLATVSQWGEAIINSLLLEGYRVIFRPHPYSFVDQDRSVIDQICRRHAGNASFSLDRSPDYTKSFSCSDLMVTDLSGTGFTYSFGFGRPTIFFAPNADAEHGLSGIQFNARHRIGALVRGVDELIKKTSEFCHRDMTNQIERFRDEAIFNVGKSAQYIVTCLENILSGCERPEWIRL